MINMHTKLIDIDQELPLAIELLASGQVIAFPTETVFGIGADITNISACLDIYRIKSRDAGKPLSAHVSSIAMAESLFLQPSDVFYRLAEQFLPGPLAIIDRKNNTVCSQITAGFDSISIRYPANATCLKLIEAYGKPIAATSANISGEKSLSNSAEVFDKFSGIIPAVVVGECEIGTESTIISLVEATPKILRIGAIPPEAIEECLKMKFQ